MIPDPDIHSLAGRFRNPPDLGRVLPHAGISMLFPVCLGGVGSGCGSVVGGTGKWPAG
jgi:hypothetical protein